MLFLHRANAAEVRGVLVEIGESGCRIKQKSNKIDDVEMATVVFVAYEDIRGIAILWWDYDVIGH